MSTYEKPYSNIASAKEVLIPEFALDKVLLLPNFPIQGNSPFQPQDRMTFSPLPTNPLSMEGGLLAIILLSFLKSDSGKKSLEKIIVKYLDSCAKIVESVQDACHSNWLTALNNQHITAAISHKIGLMDDAGYIKIMDHYRSVFDKMFALQLVNETITGVTTLVQGAKTYNQTSTKDESLGFSTSDMASNSGIAALTNILKGKIQ